MRAIWINTDIPFEHNVLLSQDDDYGCDIPRDIDLTDVPIHVMIGKTGQLQRFIYDPTDSKSAVAASLDQWYNSLIESQGILATLQGCYTPPNTTVAYDLFTVSIDEVTVYWILDKE
jgi:hypothetical protein